MIPRYQDTFPINNNLNLNIHMWNESIKTFDHSGRSSVDISPSGRYLAAGTRHDVITVLSTRDFLPVRHFELKTTVIVRRCGFSPDGRFLAINLAHGVALRRVREEEDQSWDEVKMVKLEYDRVGCKFCFSSDGVNLVTSGEQGTMIWPVDGDDRCLLHIKEYRGGGVAMAVDGSMLGLVNRGVFVFDPRNGKLLKGLQPHSGSRVNAIDFSPDSLMLASCGVDGHTTVLDTRNWRVLMQFDHDHPSVHAVKFSPWHRGLLASTGADGMLRVWDVERRHAVQTFHHESKWIWRCCFGRENDRELLAYTCGDNKLVVRS